MAGIIGSAVAFAFITAVAASLDPEPVDLLGPYTNESARWPFGGCAEVLKTYPAPGTKLSSPKTYEKDWNIRITVVFSRPVTRILWPFDSRAWIHSRFLSTTEQEQGFERRYAWKSSGLLKDDIPNLVHCAKWACLIAIHGEWIQYWKANVAATEKGSIFNDEYEFSFALSKSLEDRVSHFYFILDGGWFYAPVYKFSTRANVEYVPYTVVKYFSSGSIFLPKTQTIRESDYFLSAQTTCSARGGLIHRPFTFRRVKYDNRRRENEDGPKLLPEHKIIEASEDGPLQITKLRLYYQIKHPGVYTLRLPSSVKVMHNGENFTISLPYKTLNINFTVPRLYIPVNTRHIFDYHDRAYALAPKWIPYFFTWSYLKQLAAECNSRDLFECKNLEYISQLHKTHLVATRRKAFQPHHIKQDEISLYHYHTAFLTYYDNNTGPYQYFKSVGQTDEWYHVFEACFRQKGDVAACSRKSSGGRAQIDRLIIDPNWSMMATYDSQTMMLVDLITRSTELTKTVLRTFGVKAYHLPGMMQYTRTGSLYERDWSQAIPMINFTESFAEITNGLSDGIATCSCRYDGINGRYGTHKKMTELANLYRLHVPLDVGAWSAQQTSDVTYVDEYGHKVSLKSDIHIPDHIKKAVMRYVVLTNVEPNVDPGGDDDLPTRLRADEESYPLEKAVFVPHELLDMYGCGQLNIHQQDQNCADQCDDMDDSCSGLPFDSIERFPFIPPFNLHDLVGSTDPSNQQENGHKFKRALYYYSQFNNSWNHFILHSPNTYYTASIDIEGVMKIEEPLYAEKTCEEIWKFTPDKHEITKGYLTAMISNIGKGGDEITVSVDCTPKLEIIPNRVTMYTKPDETATVKFVLGGYLQLDKPGYQCEMSIVVGKGVTTCTLLVPTINGAFTDPCNNFLSVNNITYYVLPNDFVEQFSLQFFLSSAVGEHFMLYKLINVQLVKYHMISLTCENTDVFILPEDQLINSTRSGAAITTDRTLYLIYTTDQLLQRRLYVFVRKGSYRADSTSGPAMKCLLTLWSSPHKTCGIAARRYIAMTEADTLLAKALEAQEAIRKTKINPPLPKNATTFLSDLISENDEVVSAVLVCMASSLVLIMLTISGNSLMFLYTQLSPTERKAQQLKIKLTEAKKEHKKTWSNPQMYLRSGSLGPFYLLHNFKATDQLDTANLKTLKIAGMLKYKDKKLQVIFGHVKKIIIKQTTVSLDPEDTTDPQEVWLQASSGMYLLKQKNVSEEYKEEFHSLLQRHSKTDN